MERGQISIICLLVLSDIGQDFYNSTDIDLVLLRGESWSESPSQLSNYQRSNYKTTSWGLGQFR